MARYGRCVKNNEVGHAGASIRVGRSNGAVGLRIADTTFVDNLGGHEVPSRQNHL